MNQVLVNSLTLGSVYLIFALGMSLAWGTIGILNFAHGSIFMFSAFVAYLVLKHVHLSIVPTLIIGVVAGAAMSLIVEVFAFQPILRHNKDAQQAELQILLAGIGIAGIPVALALKGSTNDSFSLSGSTFTVRTYVWSGLHVSNIQIIVTLTGLTVGIGMAIWLRHSGTGLALRAIGVDAEVSSLMGVNRDFLSLGTMAFAGALAGLAGTLLTFDLGAISPETGNTFLLEAFAAIVLGGVGSMVGVIVGAYVIAVTETLVLTYTSGTWVGAISFAVIFAVLLVRPQGFFGREPVRRT
jgi:branched-chain amino acid transport system permease protein